ncbi:MAG: AbrB/MazE/SpoVT family DNA-binding domain-containing protein [Gammaproteobacteria bacterium]|nr:AbrB/MazE/SpoVT family DNA-binding domain-containing protein [Gammaproteobacteria bacterium]
MLASRLTKKYQTTIPKEIRTLLNLHANDQVRFEIVDNQVIISKIEPFDMTFHKALNGTLREWDSKEDDKAYRDL